MRILTANEAWFSFKGISCRDYSVRMVSPPTRLHPARKGEYIDIPGADGEVWLDGGGHKPTIISVHCIAEDNLNIDAINAWLSGGGELIFGDEPERAYKANITSEYARNNLYGVMRGQEFTVSFDCEPYRYKADTSGDTCSINVAYPLGGGTTIQNNGSVASLPLLAVGTSTGDCSITIDGKTMTVKHHEKTIFVDCAAKIAYTKNDDGTYESAAMYVSGDWLSIPPGMIFVGVDPGDTAGNSVALTITPRWRWL